MHYIIDMAVFSQVPSPSDSENNSLDDHDSSGGSGSDFGRGLAGLFPKKVSILLFLSVAETGV